MGGPNKDRVLRLRTLRLNRRGYVWLAVCDGCGHASGLPVGQLIARYGEDHPLEFATVRLRYGECQGAKVTARLARLCDPGCARQRG